MQAKMTSIGNFFNGVFGSLYCSAAVKTKALRRKTGTHKEVFMILR